VKDELLSVVIEFTFSLGSLSDLRKKKMIIKC